MPWQESPEHLAFRVQFHYCDHPAAAAKVGDALIEGAPVRTTTAPSALAGTYVIDRSHSRIGFAARYAMVAKVRGAFTDLEGGGYFDPGMPPRSRLHLRINAASIDTGSRGRDEHLRGPDFLDVDTHPHIDFVSTGVDRSGTDGYAVTGDLTIRGIAQPVTVVLCFTGSSIDHYGDRRVGFDGHGTLNRSHWGLRWNVPLDSGGVLIADKVVLELDVAALREA